MVVKTNYFYGLELDKVNEVYVVPETVCYRRVYIHPDVVKENREIDFPNKPIENCNIVEIAYFKALMVIPGSFTLRFFDTNGGDIENIRGAMKDYVEETANEEFCKAIILCSDKDVKIDWIDKEKKQWLTTIKNDGTMETIVNPDPVEYEDEDY